MYYNLQRKTCNPKVFKSFSFDDEFPDNPNIFIKMKFNNISN